MELLTLLKPLLSEPIKTKLYATIDRMKGEFKDEKLHGIYLKVSDDFCENKHVDERKARLYFDDAATYQSILLYKHCLTEPESDLRKLALAGLYHHADEFKIVGSNKYSNHELVDQFLEQLKSAFKLSSDPTINIHFADVRKDINELKKMLKEIQKALGIEHFDQSEVLERIVKGEISFGIPFKIEVASLPTTDAKIFGREKELHLLDEAWADAHSNVVSLVAWGGVGKTALVNSWLNGLAQDNYRGAERVYGHSFYSQGAGEDRQVSADRFFDEALKWFGYEGPVIPSAWDKGKKLAELICRQRTLLILDGLEPLQFPPGLEETQGRLKDQGMQALLKTWRVTTRACV